MIAGWIRRKVSAAARRLVDLERVQPSGEIIVPRGLRVLVTRLTQGLIETGRTPPWVKSPEWCRRYWEGRTSGSANAPQEYAGKDTRIVDFLDAFWGPEVTRELSVLELGPNAGTNLNRLRELGYVSLAGIEINPAAVDVMQLAYPQLAAAANVKVGSLEDVLPTLERGSVDVVFTMAVLMHVHPASARVFGEIAQIVRRYVCVIEHETASNPYVFPRNYKRVFEKLGLHELRSTFITPDSAPNVDRAYDGYVARLFATQRQA